jgi:hypothetical protein
VFLLLLFEKGSPGLKSSYADMRRGPIRCDSGSARISDQVSMAVSVGKSDDDTGRSEKYFT